MKWGLIALASLAAIVGVLAAVGAALPKGHQASVTARIARPATEVWATVVDFASWPSWNSQLERMERLPDRDGQAVWVMHDKNGKMPTRILESTAPDGLRPGRLLTRIDDPTLPFGGTWTWEVTPAGGQTEVRITEDGEIHNPIFRFMARFVLGYEGSLKAYLTALGNKLGKAAPP